VVATEPTETKKPDIYVRNFEPSKERCDRIEQEFRENRLEQQAFNEKIRPLGHINIMRKKAKTLEKHLPIKLVDTDEVARVKKSVALEANASLKESFDLKMYQQPVWKKIEKSKWRTPNGMSYSG